MTEFDRVLVYGVTGSGKSTLARRLAASWDLPYVPVDDLSYGPNWTVRSTEEQLAIFREACQQDSWIMDSAYRAWLPVVLDRATHIIALDYPRLISFGRLLRRTLHRVTTRTPVCGGNRETWSRVWSSDSILRWHFRSFEKKRATIREWERTLDPHRLRVFRHPRQLDAWIASHEAVRNR